jgi:hypothetical protein
METKVTFLALAVSALMHSSCLSPVPAVHDPAVLRLSLSEEALTRASDVFIADYILSLKGSGGKSVFKGRWEQCPSQFELEPGTYAVSLVSEELEGPAFDSPQYGDSRTVNLAEGQVAEVELIAGQLNAGLRLQVRFQDFMIKCTSRGDAAAVRRVDEVERARRVHNANSERVADATTPRSRRPYPIIIFGDNIAVLAVLIA